jgi:imidazolonepropionase-like amidohydrolase
LDLQQLASVGLSPVEAIQTARLNPAIVLGKTNGFGSIETGRVAELLFLDADQLSDIKNTRRIDAVIVDGELLRRSDLGRLLREAEQLTSQK